MGRPIKKSFFGNLNAPYNDFASGGPTGEGGESVSTVALGTAGTNYSQGLLATFSAPEAPTGTQATLTVAVNTATGAITNYSVVSQGSGYMTPPTVTLTKPATVNWQASGTSGTNVITVTTATGIYVGMVIAGGATGSSGKVQVIAGTTIYSTVVNNDDFTNAGNMVFSDTGASGVAGTVTLAETRYNALNVTAYLPAGSSAVTSDIKKQEASRRYLVRNAQGNGQCRLVAKATNTLAAGEMNLIATDSVGGTYYVTKLTARRAVITRASGTQFATGSSVGWSTNTAVENVSVKISNG